MIDIKNKVIIVLGMHRSGASLLAGCLQILGVNMGNNLLPPNKSNEAGYFEYDDLVLIHDILFRDLGSRWDLIGNLPDGWLDSDAAQQAEKKLVSAIERRLVADRLWAVKDPRICRVMPLWNRVLERMNIQPFFIFMVRHPYEVAKSLEKRHHFDLMKSHLLWMAHYRDALNACREYPHVMVTFDQLLADPLSTLQRIHRVLKLPFQADIHQQYPLIIDFIRPELKHHQSSQYPETGIRGVFSHYVWIYQQFRLLQNQAIAYQPVNESVLNTILQSNQNPLEVQLSVFPQVEPVQTQPDLKFERSHAIAMFNNLLGVIGSLERSDIRNDILREHLLLNAGQSFGALFAQVFLPTSPDRENPYSEESSQKLLLAPEEWEKIEAFIPRSDFVNSGRLRFDPLNTMGMVTISSIRILNSATGRVFWVADSSVRFESCTVMGDAFPLSREENLVLVCTGSDPQLLLPEIPDLPDCPLVLEIWIKVSQNLSLLQKKWLYLADIENAIQLEQALHSQKLLTKEYYSEMRRASSELSALQERIAILNNLSDERMCAIEALGGQIKEITARKEEQIKEITARKEEQIKEITVVKDEQIQYIKDELERVHEQRKQDMEKQCREQDYFLSIIQLSKWLQYTETDYISMKKSLRWKTGNIFIRFLEFLLFCRKQPLVTDHLDQLFQERRSWLPRFGNGKQDQEYLTALMRHAKNDFDALMNSRRWRLGHGLVSVFERLLFRGKPLLAVDHMRMVFDEYDQWVNSEYLPKRTDF